MTRRRRQVAALALAGAALCAPITVSGTRPVDPRSDSRTIASSLGAQPRSAAIHYVRPVALVHEDPTDWRPFLEAAHAFMEQQPPKRVTLEPMFDAMHAFTQLCNESMCMPDRDAVCWVRTRDVMYGLPAPGRADVDLDRAARALDEDDVTRAAWERLQASNADLADRLLDHLAACLDPEDLERVRAETPPEPADPWAWRY